MNEHENDVKARIALAKWMEGNADRPNTPEEQASLNYAIAQDAGNGEGHNAQALQEHLQAQLDQRVQETLNATGHGENVPL